MKSENQTGEKRHNPLGFADLCILRYSEKSVVVLLRIGGGEYKVSDEKR
jgi:hypothetical protein